MARRRTWVRLFGEGPGIEIVSYERREARGLGFVFAGGRSEDLARRRGGLASSFPGGSRAAWLRLFRAAEGSWSWVRFFRDESEGSNRADPDEANLDRGGPIRTKPNPGEGLIPDEAKSWSGLESVFRRVRYYGPLLDLRRIGPQ
jgi:hypothetical protein